MLFENRFTLRAENVLRCAHECAAELGHGYVGSEHILLGILRDGEGEAAKILNAEGISAEKIRGAVINHTGIGKAHKNTLQGLSPCSRRIVRTAYNKSKSAGDGFIGDVHLLVGILCEESGSAKKLLKSMGADTEKLARLIMPSGGDNGADCRKNADNRRNSEKSETKLLKNYGRDLCELVREGKLDPVIGREKELQYVIEILARRTKNNPLLLGDPGVGKTAVAEGLAERIVKGDVPRVLSGKRIFMLDISGVVAGTKYRGEFEERIRSILREVSRAGDIILFIDEIHTIVGAGAAEGAIDAANILKPALSRREIQLIGATTHEEYRKYIEPSAALSRRFQTVKIEEPSKEESTEILSGLRGKYEQHHKIRITDEAIKAAVELSDRYIPERRLPDKAIDLIDEAASRAKIYASSPPPRMRELEEKIISAVGMKERCIQSEDFEGAARFRDREEGLRNELLLISENWQKVLDGHTEIDFDSIADVVCARTGIPASRITREESQRLLEFEALLRKRVVGQEKAIAAVARAVRRGRLGFSDPRRPIGSFLFAGPTGVGKTELCRALSEALFDDENKIIRMDMSEYMEKHELSKLLGSPPGYVGYDGGVTLADRICDAPYSVILFDEIEKAHPDVMNILLQILEDGTITDSHGKKADFRNTVIVMTSNIGAERMCAASVGFGTGAKSDFSEVSKSVIADIKKSFRPELFNRIDDVIVFSKLAEKEASRICDMMISELAERVFKLGIVLDVTEEAKKTVVSRGFDEKYGARGLRREIQGKVSDILAEEYLKNECAAGKYRIYCENEEIKARRAV